MTSNDLFQADEFLQWIDDLNQVDLVGFRTFQNLSPSQGPGS